MTNAGPIRQDWTSNQQRAQSELPDYVVQSRAIDVNRRLARLQVADIQDRLVPYLAAAAAELALASGITWAFSTDDPPVALLRLIAKVTLRNPNVGGPHTDRLMLQLG